MTPRLRLSCFRLSPIPSIRPPPRPPPSLQLIPQLGRRFFPQLGRRFYEHSSPHAPASTIQHDGGTGNAGDQGTYSRWALMSEWHRAARETTPSELRWEKRDEIEAVYMILLPDGTIEKPKKRLDKQTILERYGLLPRDLRTLDSHILDVRPSLLVCKKSIVLCTPIARAIISHDQLILIAADKHNPICDAEGAEQMVASVHDAMVHLSLTEGSAAGSAAIPFELRALEALLLITVRGFRAVSSELQDRVYGVIPELRFGVSQAELRDLMEAKRTCEDALSAGRALQSAISAVLSEDEDLAGMYLTDKHNGRQRLVEDHQTAELLLEFYERRLDETNESSVRLQSLLADIDNNIALVLQSTRVRLQNLELQTAITTLALGAGTAIAGFFGMNLVSGLEEDPNAFRYAVYAGIGSMAAIMAIGWFRMVRNRRSQLFLRSYARARPHTRSLQSGSLKVPSVSGAKDMLAPFGVADGRGEGGGQVGAGEKQKDPKEAKEQEGPRSDEEKQEQEQEDKREAEAVKAKEEDDAKESKKDGSQI